MPAAPAVPLSGSRLFDPWRIRAALAERGLLQAEPQRQPTRSEQMLWETLRERPPGWVREHATGPYRLDFYCAEARLAIEVDGGSHFGRVASERDALRDKWHELRGIRTHRIAARHVEGDLEAMLLDIDAAVARATSETGRLQLAVADGAEVETRDVPAPVVAEEAVLTVPLQQWELELEAAVQVACRTVLPDLPDPRRLLGLLTS